MAQESSTHGGPPDRILDAPKSIIIASQFAGGRDLK
jgi:hypothetical protein